MIDIKTNEGKMREWRSQTRQMIILENRFAREIAPILRRQYLDAAEAVGQGEREIDLMLDNDLDLLADMNRIFQRNFRRTATVFNEKAEKALEKIEKQQEEETEFFAVMNTWIRTQAARKVRQVTETTKKIISRIIRKGMNKNKSNYEIAKDIRDKTEISTKARAASIARTETHTTAMHSMQKTMEIERARLTKTWQSANDDRVRSDMFNHIAANGEEVGLEEEFIATGEALRYPGDYMGSAGNIIRCRCIALYNTIRKFIGR